MARITLLGTGEMGSRMALALIGAGHQLTVWNRTLSRTQSLKSAGAIIADSPRSAVANAEFAISMVRDNAASRQVWLDKATGALANLPKSAIAIESSTLSVDWINELSHAFEAHGLGFLDAPVAGSRPQADSKQLIYFVGGNTPTVLQATPILSAMGAAVYHAGPVGSGAATKLIVNALFGVQIAALAELVGLAVRSGQDAKHLFELVASTPVCSPAAKVAVQAMLLKNFNPMFPLELVEKDFEYALEAAKTCQAKLPLTETTLHVIENAIQHGMANDNITGLAQLY